MNGSKDHPQTERIKLVEVGPRDGLQNESKPVSTQDKITLINRLADCGLNQIEATAFVSPRWVPQMADHDTVMRHVTRRKDLVLSALVPNVTGAQAALAAGAQHLAIFASASESFAQKNTNCTIAESLERFAPVLALARQQHCPVRAYISCAVQCPYEGPIHPDAVTRLVDHFLRSGCHEIAIADTLGTAYPEEIATVLTAVLRSADAHILTGHYHATSGRALDNIAVSLELGLRCFDSAAAGLGGCPYAPGAAGNLRTGSLVDFLEQRGYQTGIDRPALALVEQDLLTWKQQQDLPMFAHA